MGKIIIYAGIALIIVGLMVSCAPGLLKWFGHLPGDIRIESDNGIILIPITSMIVISVLLTIIANLFFRR